jgi:hypothetical protein
MRSSGWIRLSPRFIWSSHTRSTEPKQSDAIGYDKAPDNAKGHPFSEVRVLQRDPVSDAHLVLIRNVAEANFPNRGKSLRFLDRLKPPIDRRHDQPAREIFTAGLPSSVGASVMVLSELAC